MSRKETSKRIVLEDGTAVTVRIRDSITVDDLVVQGIKAEAYKVMTGRDVYPKIKRPIRNYLVKTGLIAE